MHAMCVGRTTHDACRACILFEPRTLDSDVDRMARASGDDTLSGCAWTCLFAGVHGSRG